jgi:hypothetical protein
VGVYCLYINKYCSIINLCQREREREREREQQKEIKKELTVILKALYKKDGQTARLLTTFSITTFNIMAFRIAIKICDTLHYDNRLCRVS